MFSTLCTYTSSDVHQPNALKCSHFCAHQEDLNWKCYNHPIVCSEIRDDVKNEMEEFKQLIKADLEKIEHKSKVRYLLPLEATRCVSNSINNQDENEDFVNLLMDELILWGASPVGEVEDL
jgi:hypothetical protein